MPTGKFVTAHERLAIFNARTIERLDDESIFLRLFDGDPGKISFDHLKRLIRTVDQLYESADGIRVDNFVNGPRHRTGRPRRLDGCLS
jgi:hypothetical protein